MSGTDGMTSSGGAVAVKKEKEEESETKGAVDTQGEGTTRKDPE